MGELRQQTRRPTSSWRLHRRTGHVSTQCAYRQRASACVSTSLLTASHSSRVCRIPAQGQWEHPSSPPSPTQTAASAPPARPTTSSCSHPPLSLLAGRENDGAAPRLPPPTRPAASSTPAPATSRRHRPRPEWTGHSREAAATSTESAPPTPSGAQELCPRSPAAILDPGALARTWTQHLAARRGQRAGRRRSLPALVPRTAPARPGRAAAALQICTA